MYYPKSQITTNLYTNGGEYFIINTSTLYIGDYYKVSSGDAFSGKTPNSGRSIKLVPSTPLLSVAEETNNEDLSIETVLFAEGEDADADARFSMDLSEINYNLILPYTSLLQTPLLVRYLPSPHFSSPTARESKIGEYRRYFAKKTNNLIYIEISKETYDKYQSKDPTVASELFEVVSLPWSLEGLPFGKSTTMVNKNIVALTEKDNKWYGFSSYFRGQFG